MKFEISQGPITIYANAASGRGSGLELAVRIEAALRQRGYDVRPIIDEPRDAGAAPPVDPAATIIVVGGDGTLRSVAERLAHGVVPRSEALPPILLVPTGTANLMGQHLGVPRCPDDPEAYVLDALAQRRVRCFDVARLNGEVFLLMASVALDAQAVVELARTRRGPIRKISYLAPVISALIHYNFTPISVEVDGRLVFPSAPAMAFVANIPEYGAGFPLVPQAIGDDGLLDVCVLPCRSRMEFVRVFIAAATGHHLHVEGVVQVRGRRIHIRSSEPLAVQADGEPAGQTPVDIEVLDEKLRMMVPQHRG